MAASDAGTELSFLGAASEASSSSRRGERRGRRESWEVLPQRLRGIRLGELQDICSQHRGWLEDVRWRCGVCNKSCNCSVCTYGSRQPRRTRLLRRANTETLIARSRRRDQDHGPCLTPGCCGTTGTQQMRNLYEVNDGIIKPRCEAARVSYVELLRLEEMLALTGDTDINMCPLSPMMGVHVDTFVSHWWGEEFPMLVKTLKKYAKTRCDGHCRRRRKAADWSFWICAFANNQFAVDHAVGFEGDVSTSAFAVALKGCQEMVAVIDPQAQIYKRIWCTFELFYADSLPHRPAISLANARGTFSSGAATRGTVLQMRQLLSTVRVAEAKATVEADRDMILAALQRAGANMEMLDRLLRKQVHEGLRMVCLRAKLFSQLAVDFLCGLVIDALLGVNYEGLKGGFLARYSWYIEWLILLHIPPVCGTCIFNGFLLVLALIGSRGRIAAVDWMWFMQHLGKSHTMSKYEKVAGMAALLTSALGSAVASFALAACMHQPQPGMLHEGPCLVMAMLALVLFVECFLLDLRIVPRRFVERVAVAEVVFILAGVLAGELVHRCDSPVAGALVMAFWMFSFFAACLRDRCNVKLRRRIEEPFWS